MLPLRDVIPTRTPPRVTMVLIALAAGLVLASIALPELWRLLPRNGVVLAANLWLLWLCGGALEDRLGHVRFFCLYLTASVTAAIVTAPVGSPSALPVAGATGGVAAIACAYFLLFPRSQLLVLVPGKGLIDLVEVPSAAFAGVWLCLHVGLIVATIDLTGAGDAYGLGVGAAIGLLGGWLLRRPERLRVEWWGP